LRDSGIHKIRGSLAVTLPEKRKYLWRSVERATDEPRQHLVPKQLHGAVAGLAGYIVPRQTFPKAYAAVVEMAA
jgi:hypothetical protein